MEIASKISNNLYALGVGHNTPVMIDLAEDCGYHIKGLFHYDETRTGEIYCGYKIIGSFKDLFSMEDLGGMAFLLTMGNMDIRAQLLSKIMSMGGSVPTIIHPQAVVSRFATISSIGVYVNCFSHIQAGTTIGMGTVVLSGVIINHNNKIGKHCFFADNSLLGAYTEMQDFAFMGQGALSISGKVHTIGTHAYIGARALLTREVPPHATMIGIPAKEKVSK